MRLVPLPLYLILSVSGGPEDGAGEILDHLDEAITLLTTPVPTAEEAATTSMLYISAGQLDGHMTDEDDEEDEATTEEDDIDELTYMESLTLAEPSLTLAEPSLTLAETSLTLAEPIVTMEAQTTHDLNDVVKELNALDVAEASIKGEEDDLLQEETSEEDELMSSDTTTMEVTASDNASSTRETEMMDDPGAKKLLDTDLATALMGAGIAGFMAHVVF